MAAFVARPGSNPIADAPPLFSCKPLERIGGSGDGGKWTCNLRNLRAPCTVYSLGSQLNFKFEAAVSSATPCNIVTADCTVDAALAKARLPPRTTFYPLCLGSNDTVTANGKQFVTLPTLMQLSKHTHIDLLKMDIEGSENAVIKGLLALPRESRLPYQVVVETHGNDFRPGMKRGRAQQFHLAMAALGYVAVSKEQNVLARYCWEWTWVRAYCAL